MAMARHFVDLFSLSADSARDLLRKAVDLKRDDREGRRPLLLSGRTIGLFFEKPSLRTRVSFEAAIAQLGGNPIACRAGLAAVETIEQEGLLRRGRDIGERFRGHFQAIRDERPDLVRDIRILGVMIGLDLTIDASGVVAECLNRGLLVNATHGHVIRLLPALNIGDDQVDEGCAILADVLLRSTA